MAKRHAARKGQRSQAREERVREVAKILATYEASVFQHEAACTHGIRQKLCLAGWGWHEAHDEARALVKAALDRLGARRPWWNEGQPDYALNDAHGDFVERTRCARCAARLPEDAAAKRIYCSDVCRHAAIEDKQRVVQAEHKRAQAKARHAAWQAKQPKHTCKRCGVKFTPNKPNQKYCSPTCVGKATGGASQAWRADDRRVFSTRPK